MIDIILIINFMLFIATAAAVYINYFLIQRQQWITLYFTINQRFAELQSRFPDDILLDDFETDILENSKIMNIMYQYFTFCSEEFYLKERKKWIEQELWEEWDRAITYYMSKKAFRESWRVARKDYDIYYADFIKYMDKLAKIN